MMKSQFKADFIDINHKNIENRSVKNFIKSLKLYFDYQNPFTALIVL